MHIPKLSSPSETYTAIIAIQGAPGTGKTTAALTFPNPLVANFDNKLRRGIQNLPFWDASICDKYSPRRSTNHPANYHGALKTFILQDGPKLALDQTLILDSWTMFQNGLDAYIQADIDMGLAQGSGGKDSKFYFWGEKLKKSVEIISLMKNLKCRVIILFHEQVERDDKGEIIEGKFQPLQQGSFKDQIYGHCADVWRAHKNPVASVNGKPTVLTENKGFYWQVAGDSKFNANCNPTLSDVVKEKNIKFIPATFTELQKLMNPSNVTNEVKTTVPIVTN